MSRPLILLGCFLAACVAWARPEPQRESSRRQLRQRGVSLVQLTAQGSGRILHARKAPSVVYGVMTTGVPEYRAKLTAQVETWARGLAEQGRFFSVAGASAGGHPSAGLIAEQRCPDSADGRACKEERILEEGYDRGADWLVVLGEDNYVNTTAMERLLEDAAAAAAPGPLALGIVGCGKGLGYCPEVDAQGGFCGGGGYAINRAALEAAMRGGRGALREEYGDNQPGDMASSCALRRRGVDIRSASGLVGNRIERLQDFEEVLRQGPITVHYCTADVTRWVHAYLTQQPAEEVSALEAKAFDGGCCCSWRDEDHERCKRDSPARGAETARKSSVLEMAPQPADLALLAGAYIDERDGQLWAEHSPRAS